MEGLEVLNNKGGHGTFLPGDVWQSRRQAGQQNGVRRGAIPWREKLQGGREGIWAKSSCLTSVGRPGTFCRIWKTGSATVAGVAGTENQTLRAESFHSPHSAGLLFVSGISLPLGKLLLESSSLVKAAVDLMIMSTFWSQFCLFEATLKMSPLYPTAISSGAPRRAVTVLQLAKATNAFWSS